MRVGPLVRLSYWALRALLYRRSSPLVGSIILTDKCNLSCRHCAVSNLTSVIYPYAQIKKDMQAIYSDGVRVIFFYGGEPFLWHDGSMSLLDLVREARGMGFLFVNIVTNGTFSLALPEADLILVSLDGPKEIHDEIRGECFDTVLANISGAGSSNICVYMSINQINKDVIERTCEIAAALPTVRAISFNFHTPYPGVEYLQLTRAEKQTCCERIEHLMDKGCPILNLRSAFPYIADNSFKTPCDQCVIIENGERWPCGRCVSVPGLCANCGFFFPAELSLVFDFRIPVMVDLFKTYLKCLWG